MVSQNISHIRKFGVLKIGIFGSYVKNKEKADSDIDFLVELNPEETTYDNYFDLVEYLEGLFQNKVEVVTIDSLSPYIGPHILKEVEYIESAASDMGFTSNKDYQRFRNGVLGSSKAN